MSASARPLSAVTWFSAFVAAVHLHAGVAVDNVPPVLPRFARLASPRRQEKLTHACSQLSNSHLVLLRVVHVCAGGKAHGAEHFLDEVEVGPALRGPSAAACSFCDRICTVA